MKIHATAAGFVSTALVIPLFIGIYYVRHFGRLYDREQQGVVQPMMAQKPAGTRGAVELHPGIISLCPPQCRCG
jgi:hypothetical protein